MTTETLTTLNEGVKTLKLSPPVPPSQAKPQWFSETGLPDEAYPYKHLLPTFDGHLKLPPLTEFEHKDPGHEALKHADPLAFLANAEVDELTPRFGSEVSGVQLSQLDEAGRQELALFVAQRGVVAFRDQDFIDQSPDWQINNWGAFFGRPHIHPTSGAPEGYPEFHLVYRSPKGTANFERPDQLTSVLWHSDVTYEKQPPGLTALFLYDSPKSGGDTSYVDQRQAYSRLSPALAAFVETLKATHSGVEQAEHSRKGARGGIVKREPVINEHPVVRRHPVTGEKALFINRQFTRRIVGLKKEESDALLELLYSHIERGADFQVRLRWKPRTVVLWDNRITAHSALVDFDAVSTAKRHGARITPQAERPFI